MMKTLLFSVLALLLLGGCEDMTDVTTATRDEIDEFLYGPRVEAQPKVIESRYCYKSRSDILCYDAPQPGKEDQFVGAQ